MNESKSQDSVETPSYRTQSTFLHRITKAVNEQNWFAVGLELTIVILGVVIGFQITAWGQQQADRNKEQAYLVQLAQDLRATEEQILEWEAILQPVDAANSKLLRAFFLPDPPPADSILSWRIDATIYRPLTPVTATAEALIASGDLSLIQDDSLRTEITAYVPWVKNRAISTDSDVSKWWDRSVQLANRYDWGDMIIQTLEPSMIDSLANADVYFNLPAGERIRPFPVDVEQLLSDREAYNHIRGMLEFKSGMNRDRQLVLEDTRALLALVEEQITQ